MNPNDVAPMIVGTTFILVAGGVVLLRPLARRLGDYLETITRARHTPAREIEPRIVETLDRVEERLRLLEERQDFTDSLLNRSPQQERLQPPRQAPPIEREARSRAMKWAGPRVIGGVLPEGSRSNRC